MGLDGPPDLGPLRPILGTVIHHFSNGVPAPVTTCTHGRPSRWPPPHMHAWKPIPLARGAAIPAAHGRTTRSALATSGGSRYRSTRPSNLGTGPTTTMDLADSRRMAEGGLAALGFGPLASLRGGDARGKTNDFVYHKAILRLSKARQPRIKPLTHRSLTLTIVRLTPQATNTNASSHARPLPQLTPQHGRRPHDLSPRDRAAAPPTPRRSSSGRGREPPPTRRSSLRRGREPPPTRRFSLRRGREPPPPAIPPFAAGESRPLLFLLSPQERPAAPCRSSLRRGRESPRPSPRELSFSLTSALLFLFCSPLAASGNRTSIEVERWGSGCVPDCLGLPSPVVIKSQPLLGEHTYDWDKKACGADKWMPLSEGIRWRLTGCSDGTPLA
ncbi:serine/arginine repetitive matrix protein 1-like [Triticum urartu]|uniref:serine/arginine repetitive matrix protein 1-like n=1 Tax=Triticum urartu TaxID=4572 RepID=UPI0020438CD2|nr:serine/arginine repetitive matrix protein 1-like [Triticum urartu]